MLAISNIRQATIRVSVEFYDERERTDLLKLTSKDALLSIAGSNIEIPMSEFLTYFLFKDKRPNRVGYRKYPEIREKIQKSLDLLEDAVRFNGVSIDWDQPHIETQDRSISERIGESIGLSVVNRIHGLTEADWARIKEGRSKVFDYQEYAADGTSIIEIEAKGSSVENNLIKTGSVSSHRENIRGKKQALDTLQNSTQNPPSHTLKTNSPLIRYGTIAVVGSNPGSTVRCWLVDPPSGEGANAHVARLLNRMQFLSDWISFTSPKSELAHALLMRVHDLRAMEDPFELDGIPLLKSNGEQFGFTEPPKFFDRHSKFWTASKSRIVDFAAGGIVVPLSSNELFFLGIDDKLLHLAAEQNFRNIIGFKEHAQTATRNIECRLSYREAKGLNMSMIRWSMYAEPEAFDSLDDEETTAKRGLVTLPPLPGQMHFSPEGLVFGVVPLA